MATGAFSDITILGLTYQDESVSSLQTRARDNNKHESRDKKSYHIVKDDALATNVPSLDPEVHMSYTHEISRYVHVQCDLTAYMHTYICPAPSHRICM
jgi:hypothetical protein